MARCGSLMTSRSASGPGLDFLRLGLGFLGIVYYYLSRTPLWDM